MRPIHSALGAGRAEVERPRRSGATVALGARARRLRQIGRGTGGRAHAAAGRHWHCSCGTDRSRRFQHQRRHPALEPAAPGREPELWKDLRRALAKRRAAGVLAELLETRRRSHDRRDVLPIFGHVGASGPTPASRQRHGPHALWRPPLDLDRGPLSAPSPWRRARKRRKEDNFVFFTRKKPNCQACQSSPAACGLCSSFASWRATSGPPEIQNGPPYLHG